MTEDVKIRITGDSTSAVAAFNRVRTTATSAVTQLQRDSAVMATSFSRLTSVVPQLGAVLGGLSFGALAADVISTADQLDEMAERTGVSVERLTGLEYVGRLNSLTLADMGTVLRELNKSVSEAGSGNKATAQLFRQLGVEVRDAEGKLRNAYDVLLDLAAVFPRLGQADRVAVSMALLGRNGEALAPALAQGREEMERMIARGQELNPITADLARNAAEFNDKVDELSAQIRSAMIPVLQEVIPWVTRMSTELREGTKAFGGFWSAMWNIGTSNPFKSHAEQVKAINEEIRGLELSRQANANMGRDVRIWDERIAEAKKRLQYFQAVSGSGAAAGGSSGGITPATTSSPSAKQGQQVVMGNPEAEAAARRQAAAEAARAQNELRRQQREAYEDRVGQLRSELAQWRNNTDEQRRIAQQIAEQARKQFGEQSREYAAARQELVRIDQRAADQRRQIEQDVADSLQAMALADVEMARAQADQDLALGRITALQRLSMERAHQQQITDIKRDALVERLNVLARDPDTNPVERERIYRALEQLEREHQQRMGEIKMGEQAELSRPGDAVVGSLQDSIQQGTTALIMGQQTAAETLRNIWRQTASAFVTEMITRPFAEWMAHQARMTWATIMGVNARTAAEVAGAETSTGITAMQALKTIGIKAYEAAAGVYAAIAGIPVVGPFMAPALAAGAIAAVGGFASKIFSAEGGFDIPAGVNPMVQAHAREMILPAKHADVIRGLADGRISGGGDKISLQVNAMDARSFETWLRGRGGDAIVRELSVRRRSNRGG